MEALERDIFPFLARAGSRLSTAFEESRSKRVLREVKPKGRVFFVRNRGFFFGLCRARARFLIGIGFLFLFDLLF